MPDEFNTSRAALDCDRRWVCDEDLGNSSCGLLAANTCDASWGWRSRRRLPRRWWLSRRRISRRGISGDQFFFGSGYRGGVYPCSCGYPYFYGVYPYYYSYPIILIPI